MTTSAAAPSLSGQQLPAVTVPSGRKTGLSAATSSRVMPGPRAVVGGDDGAVGQRDRRDLALPEAVAAIAFSARFCERTPNSSCSARRDALEPARRSPRSGPSRCRRRAAGRPRAGRVHASRPGSPRGRRCGPRASAKTRVLGVRQAVGAALGEAGDRLDAGGDEHVALARLDRVQGHPGGLQRGGAVAGDRGAGQVVQPSSTATTRAMLKPCSPPGRPQPSIRSSMSRGSSCGHLVERGPDDRWRPGRRAACPSATP